MPRKTVSIFDEIIGYDSVKKQLLEIADIMNNPDKYKKFGVTVPHGLLLVGEPGLGKTLMASCLLEAVPSWKKYTLRKTKPNGDFVKEIKHVFSEASKNTPAIILLDDMDKFANADKDHRDADEYVTIQSCIDKAKKKDIFVIATVNNEFKLPGALTRRGRFDRRIEIMAPNLEDAKKIIASYLSKKKFVDADIDTDLIAQILEGESCATLETIVNESGIAAGFEGAGKITTEHMVEASMKIIHNMPEPRAAIDETAIRCAYHEAAHVVTREYFNEGSVLLATIRTSSTSGGFTIQSPKGKNDHTIKKYERVVCTSLAPKAMSEYKYGEVDIGVSDDLDRAFSIVHLMVTEFCSHGFALHDADPQHYSYNPSQDLVSKRESIIAAEMEDYYTKTKLIIRENWDFLDKVAQALIEKQTITYKDIAAIRDSLAA